MNAQDDNCVDVHLLMTNGYGRDGKAINKPSAAKQEHWAWSTFRIGSIEEIFAPQCSCSYLRNVQDDNCVDVHLLMTNGYGRDGKAINKPNGPKQEHWVWSTFRIGSNEEIFAPQCSCSYVMGAQESTA